MIVVFDTSVVIQAMFWQRSTGRRCFAGVARRRFKVAISAAVLLEYERTAAILRAERFPDANPAGMLGWLARLALYVEPVPLRGRLSRDAKDNVFVATALAAQATHLITQDRDLLDLGKPFGVSIVTPTEFLRDFERLF